eukprot:gnl/TRDRNA2_/TRDRNA2_193551_c0_seq1.p1 gnl/TRDRNA2_/TRDRNA2_193551_c0~~gnl/TRDRNA2_/TRDRNA2_193551_c0_seq1.p1  ORF type:complete len:258 (-),score=22.51 gnl/TRDRNA2_/TRDRNA2_193551_c0_seq1:214-987(-)
MRQTNRSTRAVRSTRTKNATGGPSAQVQRVILVRHGEGEHNVSQEGWGTVDPRLTTRGKKQAVAIRKHHLLNGCELLVVSPLQRAVQTAVRIFSEQPTCRVVLTARHTERWAGPCDEGRPKADLLRDFPFLADWEGWRALSSGAWWGTEKSDRRWWKTRVPTFKQWLREQPERHVVVVGHGAFFQGMSGKYIKNCEVYEMPATCMRGVRKSTKTSRTKIASPSKRFRKPSITSRTKPVANKVLKASKFIKARKSKKK